MERYMREAVQNPLVTVTDMLAELRVALMDRMRYELATFHGRNFGSEILIRQGRWFVQVRQPTQTPPPLHLSVY